MAQTADHLIVIGKGRLVANQSTHEFIKSTSEVATVVRTDHVDEMKAALMEEQVRFEEGKDLDGRTTLTIPQQESDWVGALAYSYGLRLRELSEKRPSLEDAYLRMTQEHVEYHANVEAAQATEAAQAPEAESTAGRHQEKAEESSKADETNKAEESSKADEATGNAVRLQKEGDK